MQANLKDAFPWARVSHLSEPPPLFEKALSLGKNSIIESIRTPGEIFSLRKKGEFYLFAVDADPEIRYARISSRQSETDHVSYRTFLENEQREMNSTDPNAQNIARCMELADFKLWNNGTIEQLNRQVEEILLKINEDYRTVGR